MTQTKKIARKEIIFLRPNGEIATNAIKQGPPDAKTGEVPFMEIMDIGRHLVPKGKLLINGKEVYQRIFVQRVYPHIRADDDLQTNDYLL